MTHTQIDPPLISIISAIRNPGLQLRQLIASLNNQTRKNFEWVVSDCNSVDGSYELVQAESKGYLINYKVADDFGIYDALNDCITRAKGKYYLVLGADDWLEPNAIYQYTTELFENRPDLVLASVLIGGRIERPVLSRRVQSDQFIYVAGHSVGTLIRKDLHNDIGLYSNRFPIAADHFFLVKLKKNGAKINVSTFVAGGFGESGVSSSDVIGALCEAYRIALETNNRKKYETLIFIIRLIKALV